MPYSFRSIDRQMSLGLASALAILLAVVLLAHAQLTALERATERVDHTHQVLEAIGRAQELLVDAETGQRGYLLTGSRAHLRPYLQTARDADTALVRLRHLTADNLVQQRRLDTLEELAKGKLTELSETVALNDTRGRDAALAVAVNDRGERIMLRYRVLSARMAADEQRLLDQRAQWRVKQRREVEWAMLLGGAAALLVALASALRVRSALAVRARAERQRDEHAAELAIQSKELEEQNAELVAQQEAIRVALELADGANRAKSTFLTQMSHELRTPLNSVIGFANVLRRNPRGALSDVELNYLDRITENGSQLLQTINNILDLSKIEARREAAQLEPVSLPALVASLVAQLEPQAAAGQVQLAVELPSHLAPVATDPEKLRRVLINLVANALKFTRPGGRVVVRVEVGEQMPPLATAIEVRDTGIGIPADRLAVIFDVFEQGDVGIGREYGGTGLGLSISRALCQLLGCELTVTSTLGAGSVFRIALPSLSNASEATREGEGIAPGRPAAV